MNFADLPPHELKTLIDTIGQVIFVVEVTDDGNFRFVGFNSFGEAATGMQHLAIFGKCPEELMPSDAAETVRANYHRCVAAAANLSYEEYLTLPAAEGWWQTTLAPIFDDHGRVVRLLGTAVDISAQKYWQEANHEEQERYRILFDMAPVALFEEDFSQVYASLLALKEQGINDVIGHLRANPGLVRTLLGQVRVVDTNHATLQFYGASDKTALLAGLDPILGEVPESFLRELEALINGDNYLRFEKRSKRLDGEWIDAQVSILFRGAAKDYRQVLVAVEDITERNQALQALARQNQWFRTTINAIGEAIITTDVAGRITLMNPAAEALLGWQEAEVLGAMAEDILSFAPELSDELLLNPLRQVLEQRGRVEFSRPILVKNRHDRWVSVFCAAAPIGDIQATSGSGDLLGAVLIISDPHGESMLALAKEMTTRATLDGRAALVQLLSSFALSPEHSQGGGCFLFLDLDPFQLLREQLGYGEDDRLIAALLQRLQLPAFVVHHLLRLERFHWGLLLPNDDVAQAEMVAARLQRQMVRQPLRYQERDYHLDISIGIVPLNSMPGDVDVLLQAGQLAASTARVTSRRIQVLSPSSPTVSRHSEAVQQLTMLREALSKERLCLYLQPILPVASKECYPRYFEVLARLRDAEGRIISPAAFIPAAERYGLISELDRWVIRHTLSHYWQWFPDGAVALSINLSGLSLADESLGAFIEECLDRSQIPANRIHFEITETAAIQHFPVALRLIQRLRQRSCGFSLDDFGSGLSSFTYLKHLPVDTLKIDRDFIHGLQQDSVDYSFIAAFVQVAGRLGLQTIAEGVEDTALLTLLGQLGVDMVQGYGVGMPMPVEDAVAKY